MAKVNPFWKTARLLLNYKRQLGLAALGLVLSAGSFGAGLGMLVPICGLLLGKNQSVQELLLSSIDPDKTPMWRQNLIHHLADWVPQDRLETFVGVMIIIGILSVIGGLGRYIHEYMAITVSSRVTMIWRRRLYRRILRAPQLLLSSRGTSDQISRMMVDTSLLNNAYQIITGRITQDIGKGLVAITVALVVNWKLTLLAGVVAPVLVVALRKFGKRIRGAAGSVLSAQGQMLGAVHESISGISVVKVHVAEGYERRRFNRITRHMYYQEMKARKAKALSSPVIEVLSYLAVVIVAIAAAWRIFHRDDNPTELLTVLASLGMAGASLRPMSNLYNQLKEAEAAATRVLEMMETPIEPVRHRDGARLTPLPRHHGAVVFDHVTVRYPHAPRAAVDDVSLVVPFGRTVAIVGGNGSGKTTLLNLLPRLLTPETGRVTIDDRDISNVRLRHLRGQMASVTQQTILFQGTIADNIAYGRRWESMDRIIAAARAAYADEFITALPKGYLHPLGEGGSGLSGGQKQRLCIARAILRDPAIMILDEATSQIDADSEAKITQAINALRQGRTTFVIAHRLSTVVDADVIVVMDQGRIIDQGKHGELLTRCRLYQTLVQTQLLPPVNGLSPGVDSTSGGGGAGLLQSV